MAIQPREALITDAVEVLAPVAERLRAAGVDVRTLEPGVSSQDAAEAAADVPVVIIGHLAFGEDDIGRLRKTGLLIRAGVGYDVIDIDAATRAGIWVANVPDFCLTEVADHTLMLLLAAVRRLPHAMATWRDRHSWKVTDQLPTMHRIGGSRLGIVGLGRIGRLVADRAAGFGWEIVGHDPFLDDDQQRRIGIEPVGLDELFATSDAVSLHCPLTEENVHMVDAERLASARPGMVLVNTSRGSLVDLDALNDAVADGRIGYAALDVLDGEPNPDLDHPLLSQPNVIVTSHTAWCSAEASVELSDRTAAEALRFLDGERPHNLVNPAARRL